MKRTFQRATFASTLALAALTLAATAAVASPKSDAIALIPNDAVTAGVVRLADLRTSPISSALLMSHADEIGSHGEADHFLGDAGLDLQKDVDLVMVATTLDGSLSGNSRVLVVAEGRFNPEKLGAALVAHGAVKKVGTNGSYYEIPNDKTDGVTGAAAFPTDHLAIMGSESAVIAALTAHANGGTTFTTTSGLGRELTRIDPHASAWALIDVARAQRLSSHAHVATGEGQMANVTAALKSMSTIAIWATDSGDALELGATGLGRDEETLQLVEDTVRGALSAMRLAVQDKNPELVSALRRFTVARTAGAVTVSGKLPADTIRNLTAKQRAAK